MKKYYYIIIDKSNKTLELIQSNNCQAVACQEYMKSKGLENENFLNYNLQCFFNGELNKIDKSKLYKYCKNYKVVA